MSALPKLPWSLAASALLLGCGEDAAPVVAVYSAEPDGGVVAGVLRERDGGHAPSGAADASRDVPSGDTSDATAHPLPDAQGGPPDASSAEDNAVVAEPCKATGKADPCNGQDDNCNGQTDEDPCDDQNACTLGDACKAGACAGATALACDDGKPCTLDGCVPASGCAAQPAFGNCDDGNACTQGDACAGGVCAGQPIAACADNNPCTADSCDPKLGCVFAANQAACDDGNPCTVGEACAAGVCGGGTKLPCDDGNPCTADSCGAGACQHVPNSLPCNDNSACTFAETCGGGVCGGGLPLNCDDGNPCTADTCAKATGCQHAAKAGAPCSDGNPCTLGDVCNASGQCAGNGAVSCDDKNPCTSDACSLNGGCVFAPNTLACNDGDACSGPDACNLGQCAGKPIACDDGNPCTAEACDKQLGCLHIATSQPCNDGNACTAPDACSNGACTGKAVDCNDDNPCTVDGCGAAGCVHGPAAAKTPCGDIGVCLGAQCSPGSDLHPAKSCVEIRDTLPGAKSGAYWLDPDQAGSGSKYQAFCDMDHYGGGWLRIDNAWANELLTMTNPFITSGLCKMTPTELRAWDGFDGAPGYGHLCLAVRPQGNFMAYSELRLEGVQLTGYTAGKGNTYDLFGDCYGFKSKGAFCAGPNDAQQPAYSTFKSIGNGEVMGPTTKLIALGKTYSDFEIRAREEGPQKEGIIWNKGAFLLR